tara:strand:+ start:558 stop:1121 length:564 start_codon:yes stop_codon:yes gene_type:complete
MVKDNLNVINKWVHEYDFNYSDILLPHLNNIYQAYLEKPKDEEGRHGFDLFIHNPIIDNIIAPKLREIVQRNFYAGDCYGDEIGMRVYVQHQNNPIDSFYHNHSHLPGNLIGVFYLNIPEEGGEICFTNPPFFEELKIKPKINKVYFFPHWLLHKASPHKGDKPRFCFNWTYGGMVRPIHKYTRQLF